jgi:hypothetical protein
VRVEIADRELNEYGTEIWYEDRTFKVITCDGSVGISGGRGRGLDWWPDFRHIHSVQIAAVVAALLSAYEWAVRHPGGGPDLAVR